MILILSDSKDDAATAVERSLRKRRGAYARLDPADLALDGGGLVVRVGKVDFQCQLRTATTSVDLASVRAVWVRRPNRVEAHRA